MNNTTESIIYGMPSHCTAVSIEEALLHAHAASISLSGRLVASGFTRGDQIKLAATFASAIDTHRDSS